MNHSGDPLLTLDEVGELLGSGPGLPRRLVAAGRLGAVRRSGRLRVPFSAVLAYLTTADQRSADSSATASGDAA